MAALEVLYIHSAENWWSGIPRPPFLTLWARIYLRSESNSSPPKIAGKKASLRESSIGPIREPFLGTVLFVYFN